MTMLHDGYMTTQSLSESEALRMLDLPTNRRPWLRQQLPSMPIGGMVCYEREAVERLKEKIDRVTRANEPEHTRVIEGNALHQR